MAMSDYLCYFATVSYDQRMIHIAEVSRKALLHGATSGRFGRMRLAFNKVDQSNSPLLNDVYKRCNVTGRQKSPKQYLYA